MSIRKKKILSSPKQFVTALRSIDRPGIFPVRNPLLLTFVSPDTNTVAGPEQALSQHS